MLDQRQCVAKRLRNLLTEAGEVIRREGEPKRRDGLFGPEDSGPLVGWYGAHYSGLTENVNPAPYLAIARRCTSSRTCGAPSDDRTVL